MLRRMVLQHGRNWGRLWAAQLEGAILHLLKRLLRSILHPVWVIILISLSLLPSLLDNISLFYIIIGTNGSVSHPIGHLFHPLSSLGVPQPGVTQPGVTQLGVTQPGVAQPGITQPGVPQPGVALQPGVMTQLQVVQQRALQLHNVPQYMAACFQMSHSKFYTLFYNNTSVKTIE